MRCPFCGEARDRVLDSREADGGRSVRRRRMCASCSRRFTTYEVAEEKPLLVLKRDGRREPFSGDKLRAGIALACEKRPVETQDIDALALEIKSEILALHDREKEVPAREIGALVMARLKKLDAVAYMRFASVYRQFGDLGEFEREIARLRKARKGRGPARNGTGKKA